MRYLTQLFARLSFALLLLVGLIVVPSAAAQTNATELTSLAVELWPDYDRPAVLVLLTGELPAGTALPATVTIPIPSDADINAVARFDDTGTLLSDVEYTTADGQMTLTTPAPSFRVEYYVPYEVAEDAYSFAFEWLADLDIEQMSFVVQEPLAATDITITPTPTGTASRGDGLTYHTLAARPVSAGEPVTVRVNYTVEAPLLSAPSQTLPAATAASATAATEGGTATTAGGFNPLWVLAIAGGLGLLVVAWYLGQRQGRARRARKPQPNRPAKSKPNGDKLASGSRPVARYCHQCGQPAQPQDVYCRNCGTQLKG
jgi:hypothetical protein